MTRNSIQDITKVLTERYGLEPKEAERFVNVMFDTVREGVERESLVKIKGLGTFKIIGVEARESVNVNTGERVVIDSHGKVTFTPDSIMKELVNKPFSQFETVILNDGIEFDDIDDKKKEEFVEPEQSIGEESMLCGGNEVVAVEPDSVEPVDEKEPVENVNVEHDMPTDTSSTPEVDTVSEETAATSDAVIATEEVVLEEDNNVQESIPTDEMTVSSDEENALVEVDTVDERPVVVDDDHHYERTGTVWKFILYCFATLFLMGVSAYVGYGYGRYMAKEDCRANVRQKIDEERQAVVKHREIQKTDSIRVKPDTAVVKPKKDSVAVEKKVKEQETLDSSKYEKMDNRVRTGAYRIVGTDKVVTVKAGETLDRISKRILGEGMSCYIEVYNGLTEDAVLKEGQKLMIPKLELKKRLKK